MFLREISETRWPGMPVMEDAVIAPTATRFEIEMFRSPPAAGTSWPRPRWASRTKIGARTLLIRIFDTETCARRPPSTVSITTPALRSPFQACRRPTMVQSRKTMCSKSAVDSVPSLRAL